MEPRVYRVLPWFMPMAAITLFGRVFAQERVNATTIAHEAVHVAQQARDGWRFYIRYAVFKQWRVRYEAEAYVEDLLAGASLEWIAKTIAGPLYLWPCSVEQARQAVLEAYKARMPL